MEMLKTEDKARSFQHIPRDLGNVNVLKNIMLDRYYCIISTTMYSPKCTKSMALYFVAIQSTFGWTFSLIFVFQVMNGSAVIKYSGLEVPHLCIYNTSIALLIHGFVLVET